MRDIRGMNNQVINKGTDQNVVLEVHGNENRIEIQQNARIANLKIVICGNGHKVTFGENVFFNSGMIIVEGLTPGEVFIGRDTTCWGANIHCMEGKRVILGKDCMLSDNLNLWGGDSHSVLDLQSRKRINPSADIIIHDHVWLGQGVTILKGVELAPDIIVANHALVTKSCKTSHCVLGGMPAAVIKTGVTWDRNLL